MGNGPTKYKRRLVRPGIEHGDLEIMKLVSHLGTKNFKAPAERQYIPMRSALDLNTGNHARSGSFGGQASD